MKTNWRTNLLIAWGIVTGVGVFGVFLVAGKAASDLEWQSSKVPVHEEQTECSDG